MLQPLPLPVRPSCDASGSSAKHCADGRYSACATTTQKLRRKLASLKVAAGQQRGRSGGSAHVLLASQL
jgi:hypothetical protein